MIKKGLSHKGYTEKEKGDVLKKQYISLWHLLKTKTADGGFCFAIEFTLRQEA